MEQFFKENYLTLLYSVQIMAAFTGLLFYKKFKFSVAKFFIFFLLYVVFRTLIAKYTIYVKEGSFLNFLDGTIIETNHWWSTLSWKIGAILFFTFYYSKVLKSNLDKKIVKFIGILFFIISFSWIIFNWEDFFKKFFPIISVSGAIVILICTILYFVQILRSEKILVFYKSLNFYISSAILVWWLVITPLIFFDIYFTTADWDFIILKWQIYLFANFFMYATFTIGLIVSKPEVSK